jgi:3-methyladenine DNA glycosylase AlkD
MKDLKKMGTEQNRKVYARHGVNANMYGVSFANLNALKKKIGRNHPIAQELWATGNHDARILATMIAEPDRMIKTDLEAWAQNLDNYIITDAFSQIPAQSKFAKALAEKWIKSKSEWIGEAGWNIVSHLAMRDPSLPDAYFITKLNFIQTKIHTAKNRARHAMNNAVIAIGIRSADLEKQSLAVAQAIGKVIVDHGETGCKTPDASAYIRKTLARKGFAIKSKFKAIIV